MKHITILCDYNYIHYAVALLQSLPLVSQRYVIHFLCLDNKTFNVISTFAGVKCYREDIFAQNAVLQGLKKSDHRYFLWSLASIFSLYIMTIVLKDDDPESESVMYIDADVYFHKDIGLLYEAFADRDVGIFRHRFLKDDDQSCPYGKFNVGVVYFKRSAKGTQVLSWWADAVLHKKYPKLATCGDQRYLDRFPAMCAPDEIFIDGNIGHGAPWNWAQYRLDNVHRHEIEYRNCRQDLLFTHFSKFKFSFATNTYGETFYGTFTDNGKLYDRNPGLKQLHAEYFVHLQKTHAYIQQVFPVKIAVGIIVFEGDFVLQQCIEQIYPFVSQIVIAEGPVKFWQDRGRQTSEDTTNAILDTFPDPDHKISICHGCFAEKLEESNAYMKFIRPDTDYLWQIDADELYRQEDIRKIKYMLYNEQPTSVGVQSCSFYGGFDRHLTGFEQKTDNFLRIFKYAPGCRWQSHRPPTIQYPADKIPPVKKHINSLDLFQRYGVQMYHYSYVFPKQVYAKTMYYTTFVQNGTIPNYYNTVFLPWVQNDDDTVKKAIEDKYQGVHEWIPARRGPCFTAPFDTTKHPEVILRDLPLLTQRLQDEIKRT